MDMQPQPLQFAPMQVPQLRSGSNAQAIGQFAGTAMNKLMELRNKRRMGRPHRQFPHPHQEKQLEIGPEPHEV